MDKQPDIVINLLLTLEKLEDVLHQLPVPSLACELNRYRVVNGGRAEVFRWATDIWSA